MENTNDIFEDKKLEDMTTEELFDTLELVVESKALIRKIKQNLNG